MKRDDLNYIEQQLKYRLPYKNLWFRKQDDLWDSRSNYIYETLSWELLIKKIENTIMRYGYDKKAYFYYTINRWYNFWSAQAIERIFSEAPEITLNPNPKKGHFDFYWQGIPFDHKTSIFPKGFKNGDISAYDSAKAHPGQLALWLYENQSTGQRYHLKNRLFLIVYAKDGAHYRLKAEINWLRTIITNYVRTFDPAKLIRLQLQEKQQTLTDIIWAEE